MTPTITTSIKGFVLQPAEKKDAALILQLINELAEYEKMADQVSATVEDIEESIFSNKGAEVYLAQFEGQTIGYVLFFYNYSTFLGKSGLYIEDIYIRPHMRGRGFGKEIFEAVKVIAGQRKCRRIEWACLDWNQPSIDFYKSMGAIPMDEWTTYRLIIEDEPRR